MKAQKLYVLAPLVALILLTSAVPAGADGDLHIVWHVMSGGGGHAASPHYSVDSSIGQSAVGISASPSFTLGGGFLYVLGIPQAAAQRLYLPVVLKRAR
jgi:hypothetical protein